MSGDIGWKFPSSGGGVVAGFNDSGIETFAGKPFESLAREIIQNSLDARDNKDLLSPVTISFELAPIKRDDFPGREDLLHAMKQCLLASKGEKKAENFFSHAIKILSADEIACLKVSDYNTTGLRDGEGGEIKTGQWERLVKATGKSANSDIAGGSFGIGKNAPFAVSDLRTVFYYTHYNDSSGEVYERMQGKAILVSHEIAGGEDSQAVGFYGKTAKCTRLEKREDIPAFFHRSPGKDGTTLLIPGLGEMDKWRERIIAAVVSNYFLAIHRGQLEVMIDHDNNEYVIIDAENLGRLLADPKIQNAGEHVKIAHAYYRAISEEGAHKEESELSTLGHCILWILLEENCPQSVAIMRRGMQITDRQAGLIRWGSCADFAAVCVCDNDQGNALLRQMENPAHDAFEPDRLGGDALRGRKALKELSNWVRDKIKEVAESGVDKITPLEKMTRFFARQDENLPGEKNTERNFDGSSAIETKPIKVRPEPASNIDDGDDSGDEEGDVPVEGDGEGGEGDGNGTGGGGGLGNLPMKLGAPRVLAVGGSKTDKRVMFTPQETGLARLSLKIAGDSFVEDIGISDILDGDHDGVAGGGVKLRVEKNRRVALTIRLANSVDGALSVSLSRNKEEKK